MSKRAKASIFTIHSVGRIVGAEFGLVIVSLKGMIKTKYPIQLFDPVVSLITLFTIGTRLVSFHVLT